VAPRRGRSLRVAAGSGGSLPSVLLAPSGSPAAGFWLLSSRRSSRSDSRNADLNRTCDPTTNLPVVQVSQRRLAGFAHALDSPEDPANEFAATTTPSRPTATLPHWPAGAGRLRALVAAVSTAGVTGGCWARPSIAPPPRSSFFRRIAVG
jgi:hypothetical protein